MCGVTRFEEPSFLCSSFSLLLWAALSHSLSPLPYPPVGTLPGDSALSPCRLCLPLLSTSVSLDSVTLVPPQPIPALKWLLHWFCQ